MQCHASPPYGCTPCHPLHSRFDPSLPSFEPFNPFNPSARLPEYPGAWHGQLAANEEGIFAPSAQREQGVQQFGLGGRQVITSNLRVKI